MAKRNRRKAVLACVKIIALVILLASGLLYLRLQYPALFVPEGFKQAVDQAGFLIPLGYVGLMTLLVVISPIPSTQLL
ncbi:hypothetical protein [Leptolyngbya sp. FACHB-17]|uniref:hypothetical protein n=1 Tax=unclassified Leptolyngbya TaxID=2650499 RepID=UPI0016804540|nr:hypothetical protein [Leptolyngbya sp. FACHB-17]MBD2078488.1 hypothetical protein [Leptolyngbya sp. FACHB-17]